MGVSEADAAAAIEELVRRRVLESVGERLEVSHDRVNQVVYEEIVPARRAVLHRAVALALESSHADQLDDVADQLGHHFLRAGDAQNALVYLKRFADIAGRRYALDAALSALELAAGAVDRLPAADRDRARLDLALRQAFVLAVAGRSPETLALLEANASLQRRVADPGLASEYYFRLAMSHAYLLDGARSRLAGEAALREGERAGDPLCVGKALYALAAGAYARGAHREAVAHDVRAVPFLDRPDSQYWLGLVYWNQGANELLTGELDAAMASTKRCDTVAEAIEDRRLLSLSHSTKSFVSAARGDSDGALEYGRQALDVAPDPVASNSALASLGFAHLERHDAPAARSALEQALQSLERAPVGVTWVRALVFFAEVQRREGDATARATAQKALDSAQRSGNPYQIGLAERVLAAIALTGGDPPAAEAGMRRAIEAFHAADCGLEAAFTALDLARVLASSGRADEAREELDEAVRTFRGAGAPARVAQAEELARALGLSARGA
jgi:tetratricopeptide (TPR) repeat protein